LARKSIWAIDIGSSAVRAVKLVRNKDKIRLADYDIRDLSYVGREEDKILDAIRKALIGLAGRKSLIGEKVIISVPGSLSFQRVVKIPPCPISKIPELMGYEAQQQIPFKLDEVIWDYQLISAPEDVSQGRKVALFAVKKQIVEPLLRFCSEAMMRVVGIQLTHIASLNYLSYELQPDKAIAVLNVGARYSELVIADRTDLWLRALPFAGMHLTEAIAERSRSSFLEAEEEKKSILTADSQAVTAGVDPAIRNLVAETTRSLGFYRAQNPSSEPATLFVTGRGFSFEKGLRSLEADTRLPVFITGAPKRIEYTLVGPEDVFAEDCRQLSCAMGMALQGLGEGKYDTNLLPSDAQLDNLLADKRIPVALGVILLWAVVLWAYFLVQARLDTARFHETKFKEALMGVQDNDKKLKAVLSNIPPRILQAKNLASYTSGRTASYTAINSTLAAVAETRKSASGVWLKSISISDDTREKLNEWALSLGNATITTIEHLVIWKAKPTSTSPEDERILATLEPSRITRWLKCEITGEAIAGLGAEKLSSVEALRSSIEKMGGGFKDVKISTDWKEIAMDLPGGSVQGIDFEITFLVEIPPYDGEWNKPAESESPEEAK